MEVGRTCNNILSEELFGDPKTRVAWASGVGSVGAR